MFGTYRPHQTTISLYPPGSVLSYLTHTDIQEDFNIGRKF